MLELYSRSPIALTSRDDVTCRSYAHSIARAVLVELTPAYALTVGSSVGVFRRGDVHIACGILAAHHEISVEGAMARLRAGVLAATWHHRDRPLRHRRRSFRARLAVIAHTATELDRG